MHYWYTSKYSYILMGFCFCLLPYWKWTASRYRFELIKFIRVQSRLGCIHNGPERLKSHYLLLRWFSSKKTTMGTARIVWILICQIKFGPLSHVMKSNSSAQTCNWVNCDVTPVWRWSWLCVGRDYANTWISKIYYLKFTPRIPLNTFKQNSYLRPPGPSLTLHTQSVMPCCSSSHVPKRQVWRPAFLKLAQDWILSHVPMLAVWIKPFQRTGSEQQQRLTCFSP